MGSSGTAAPRLTKLGGHVGGLRGTPTGHSVFTSLLRPPRSVGVEFHPSNKTISEIRAIFTKLTRFVLYAALIPKMVFVFKLSEIRVA